MITSVDNKKIKDIAKLNIKKYRNQAKMFIVEGSHLVNEARECGVLIEAYSINQQDEYIQVSESVMKKICNTDTVVSEIGICKMVERNELSFKILILDRVQDPGNVGALLRSAKAFGFDTVVLGEGSCDVHNDKVIRASQGAIFKLNIINANLLDFIPKLIDYRIYGTNVINGISINEIEKSSKIAIVLGNEGSGISNEVFGILDKNIYIPLKNTESLNVAVAGGIIMYELSK